MTKVIARFIDCFSPLTKTDAYNLKISGMDGAVRYLGHYTHPEWGKGTSKEEARIILSEHLAFLPVWEGSGATSPSFFTHQQGVLDGGQALHEAESIGYPAGKPIFFAVDHDAQPGELAAIQAYIDGARKSLAGKYKAGIYGGIRVIDGITADEYWQTIAWSGGKISPRACMLQQKVNVKVRGISVDMNEMYRDPGAWTLAPKPAPAPAPKEHYNVVVGWFDSEEQAAAAAKEITMLHHWHAVVEKAQN